MPGPDFEPGPGGALLARVTLDHVNLTYNLHTVLPTSVVDDESGSDHCEQQTEHGQD